MRISPIVVATLFALASCSNGSDHEAAFDAVESMTVEAGTPEETATAKASPSEIGEGSAQIPVSLPQIAYSYKSGFRIPATEIPNAQQAHIALCEKRGPNICRVLNMENSGGEGDYATGMLHLEVAAKQARDFGAQLAQATDEFGGSQIAASISGEDLSKQIVDTEARLRSREILSQRLTELLRTKSGSVKELVEAERAVTQVNEEIDQARSWLKEMRGRVAYSKIIISYESAAPGAGGFMRPIREALGGVASTLGYSVGAAISFFAATLPWIIIFGLAIYLRRRFKSADRTFWGRPIEKFAPTDD